MYSAVIFDLDGTLLNTLTDLANAGNHTLEVLGFPTHAVDAYRYMVGNGIPKLIERMLPEGSRGPATQQTAFSVFLRYYEAHKQDTTAPYPGILPMLHALKAAGLRKDGVNIIACPTCGRTRIDLIRLANEVEQALSDCQKPITVAVMGCVVNGPGEAREADVGIAGGDGCGILFVRGKQLKKLSYDELLPALLEYIEQL